MSQRFPTTALLRCEALVSELGDREPRRCPFAVQQGREMDSPGLCVRCRGRSRRRSIALVGERYYHDESPHDNPD